VEDKVEDHSGELNDMRGAVEFIKDKLIVTPK
jgi:hypothetical protein